MRTLLFATAAIALTACAGKTVLPPIRLKVAEAATPIVTYLATVSIYSPNGDGDVFVLDSGLSAEDCEAWLAQQPAPFRTEGGYTHVSECLPELGD